MDTESGRDTSTLGGGLGEEGIIEKFLGSERLAEVKDIAQKQRLRGSARVSLASTEADVFLRRAVLEAIEGGLQELNGEFPDERSKAGPEQDPAFREQRDSLISRRGELIKKQRLERGTIRNVLKEERRLKGETTSPF